MVLAYQQQDDKGKSKRKLEVFEKHLKEEGLEIETEHATVMTQIRNLNRHFKMKPFSYFQASQDHKTSFMKIHAPNIVLERYADIVNMQKPIKVTIDILSLLNHKTMQRFTCISYGDDDGNEERKKSWLQEFWDRITMKQLFEYNHKLIPPDPDFFSAGISFESDDK